jgi:hypothetical protein
MRPRVSSRKAIRKTLQEIHQLRLQPTNLFGIHAWASGTPFHGRSFVDNQFNANINLAL